jgi:hypothetical protein
MEENDTCSYSGSTGRTIVVVYEWKKEEEERNGMYGF